MTLEQFIKSLNYDQLHILNAIMDMCLNGFGHNATAADVVDRMVQKRIAELRHEHGGGFATEYAARIVLYYYRSLG